MEENGKRYIGLDVHKHYLIALGVDADLKVVLPVRRVELIEPGKLDEKESDASRMRWCWR